MIRNARINLGATAVNNLAVACVVLGLISPAITGSATFGRMLAWTCGGSLLHWLARRILGGLMP
jgi:hypothetical protein